MKVITIGRSSNNDIVIDDSFVGRNHCQVIQSNNGSFRIVDLNTKNGTYVNGQRINGEAVLANNDIVRIGNTTLPWRHYFESERTLIQPQNQVVQNQPIVPHQPIVPPQQPAAPPPVVIVNTPPNINDAYRNNHPEPVIDRGGYNHSPPPSESKGNGFGAAALVCGLVGLFLFPIILGILAIIFGGAALSRKEKTKGLGVAGLVLGIINVILGIFIWVLIGSLFLLW